MNEYKILFLKSIVRIPLQRFGCKMKDNIKMVIEVMVWKDVDWAAKLSLVAPSFRHVMYKMQHIAQTIPN
jgi:hypothetical protein